MTLQRVPQQAPDSGHGLRALVSAHLSAARAAWPGTPRSADSTLAAIQQVIDVFAEGYEQAQLLALRQEEAARREFIDDLLHGRSDLGRLAERAERFGLRLSHAHAVAVAQATTAYDEADPVPRRLEQALIARFGDRNILLTTKDGRMLCIAPGDQEDVLTHFAKHAYAATDGGRVAIGRPQPGPGGVVQSYEEALNALELAERLELDDPVLRAADLLVYPSSPATARPCGPRPRHPRPAHRRPAPPGHPHRLLRLRLRRHRSGPPALPERPRPDVPPGTHPQTHRRQSRRPGPPLHAPDRGHRCAAAGLARQGIVSSVLGGM